MTQITAQLTSRGDTSANWIAADPEIAAKEIVFTTDVFYTGTDQMKFKVGDGVQTWSQLDYMPIGTSTTPTLAQVLAQGATTSGNNITISAGDYITSAQYYLNGSKFIYAPNVGNNNIGIGGNTFNLTTTAVDSIGIGMNVMKDITTGFENIGIGVNSMFALTTGSNNVAMGHNTMLAVTAATECSAFGDDAMYANVSGNQLSAFGAQALKNATGNLNSGFGYYSGVNISTGTGNTMIGSVSGQSVTTGTNNVFIGYNTTGASALTNGIGIGYNVTVTQDNSMILGNGVDVGIGTSTPGYKLHVVGTTHITGALTLGTSLSTTYTDAKIKGSVAATAGLIPYGTGTADTLTTSANLKYTAAAFTVATTLAATGIGNTFTVTGNNINPSLAEGLRVSLTAGFTNAGPTIGAEVYNASAGTGTNLKLATSFSNALGNAGVNAFAHATTTGYNIGGYYEALGGNINVGAIGKAITAKASATNVGVIGVGLNTGATPIQVGGYFALDGSDTPTFTSAALMCDNGSTTSNIFAARDNGTIVWSIADGGTLTAAEAANIAFGTVTGTKIGTATGQKIGFWNATPIVQPTTAGAAATFVANTSGIADDTATFDGYTIGQVVKALRNSGLLA